MMKTLISILIILCLLVAIPLPTAADDKEIGRYQIFPSEKGISNFLSASFGFFCALLLDTTTGKTWRLVCVDMGTPMGAEKPPTIDIQCYWLPIKPIKEGE